MIEAYPLNWPEYKKRTSYRESSRFRIGSFAIVRDELFRELELLGAKSVVLSTNIQLRKDGLPYASFKTPSDPGAAVYFQYKKKSMCFACDRWAKIEENIQAIRHTINALRGIARWGSGDMLEAAFTGFQAIEGPGKMGWRTVLGLGSGATLEDAARARNNLMRSHHPDVAGGDSEKASQINAAYEEARKELS